MAYAPDSGLTLLPPEHFLTLFGNLVYTALGAALSYSKWGRKRLRVYYLSDVLDIFELDPKVRVLAELGIFIAIGCAISMGIVRPQNAAQAFSAGLGWTGLMGRVR